MIRNTIKSTRRRQWSRVQGVNSLKLTIYRMRWKTSSYGPTVGDAQGAVHHVTCKGNERKQIFRDNLNIQWGQVCILNRSFYNHMIMIVHQALGMATPIVPFIHFFVTISRKSKRSSHEIKHLPLMITQPPVVNVALHVIC